MMTVWRTLRWLLTILLLLLLVSTLLRSDWFSAALLALTCSALVVPSRQFNHPGLYQLLRGALVVVALLAFLGVIRLTTPASIYASDSVRSQLVHIYDEKMQEWPVPYEDRYIKTEYGRVHVIISGTAGKPPLLLLHASGVSSWSWKYNVKGLSEAYRIYAIDTIGDAGKSEYASLKHVLHSKKEQADLYATIADKLGVDAAYVVGASEGGFIASNFARYHPDKVKRLVLIGPMGYSGATGSIVRIMLTQFFPLRTIQEETFAWAFSRNPALQQDFGEWFHLVMGKTTPIKVAPLPFSAEERQALKTPVLFIFGKRDNLVGDPHVAEANVQVIPNVSVRIIDAGHLAAAEQPALTNTLIHKFFAR